MTDDPMGAVLSAVTAYGDAREQAARDELQQQIESLTKQLADCQADDTEPAGLLIGARAKESTSGDPADLIAAFQHAEAVLGPLQITRAFEGALPARHVPVTPDGVVEVVSYKSATAANVRSFVESMRPGTLLAFHHEPEGPNEYDSGAQFVQAFNAEAAKVHDAGAQLGMISGGYQWRAKGRGRDGSFLPDTADWLGFDTYRDGSNETGFGEIVPLASVDEFQAWYAAVKGRGLPLYITEYGRGTVGNGEVASTPSKRAAAIAADVPYLQGLGVRALILWYSDFGPDGRHWRFTDAASVQAVNAAPRG